METQLQELSQKETLILDYAGLDLSDVYRYYMDTLIINTKQPPLVFLHGYLGCSICYSPLFKKLKEKFLVLVLDLRGFGRSSRPNFSCQTVKETQDPFSKALEATFKKMEFQKTIFFLAGHSLGGYLATLYVQKHPHQIRQLFLINPLGFRVNNTQEQFNLQSAFEVAGPSKFVESHFEEISNNFLKEDWSIYGVVRKTFRMKSTLNDFLMNDFKIKQEFLETLEDYMIEVINMSPSGEFCYNRLFDCPFFTKEDLSSILEETTIPTNLIFGENDLLFDDNVFDIQTRNSSFIKINIIAASGHMIHLMNANELSQTIIFETNDSLLNEPESPIPFF